MFFKDCTTPQEVKNTWRKLCFQHHPDIGGDLETMKTVNVAYHLVLASMNGQTSFGTDGKEHTYRYNEVIEQEIMDKISELLKLKVEHNTDWQIELIGTWIWLSDSKREEKDLLNKNGAQLKWHSKRGMWYWRKFTYRRKMSKWTTSEMRQAYGSQVFEETQTAIVPA